MGPGTLAELHRAAGAALTHGGPPRHHGDAAAELIAARTAAGMVDLSDRGLLRITGARRSDYLHRVTAQAFHDLAAPRGARAALLERTGKIVDILTVLAFDDHLLAFTSAGNLDAARDWLGKFIFREDVQVADRTGETGQLLLLGPRAGEVAVALAGPAASTLLPLCWLEVADLPGVTLCRWSPIGDETFLVVGDAAAIARAWEVALERGGPLGLRPVGEDAFQALRILAGVPEGGAEIDATANPIELGLEDTMDLAKGCFTGQEAIAKMITHKSVKRCLAGVEVGPAPLPAPGTILRTATEVVGRVTSAVECPDDGRQVALALIRREHAGPGVRLFCGEEDEAPDVTIAPLPFPPAGEEI